MLLAVVVARLGFTLVVVIIVVFARSANTHISSLLHRTKEHDCPPNLVVCICPDFPPLQPLGGLHGRSPSPEQQRKDLGHKQSKQLQRIELVCARNLEAPGLSLLPFALTLA